MLLLQQELPESWYLALVRSIGTASAPHAVPYPTAWRPSCNSTLTRSVSGQAASVCWGHRTSASKHRPFPKEQGCLKTVLAKWFVKLPWHSCPHHQEHYGVADDKPGLMGSGRLSQTSWGTRVASRALSALCSFPAGKTGSKPKDNPTWPRHQPPSLPDASTPQVSSRRILTNALLQCTKQQGPTSAVPWCCLVLATLSIPVSRQGCTDMSQPVELPELEARVSVVQSRGTQATTFLWAAWRREGALQCRRPATGF